MVKVCHMTSAHDSNDTRIFYKECTSLAANGYDTYLVARGESREENGVHIIGVGPAPASRIKRMTTFARKVYRKALELDCDIYHFHDPELLPYGLKLKKHGKKVIFDSHENTAVQISEKGYIPKFARQLVSELYKAEETLVVKRLDAVIVPCTFAGQNIFGGRAKRTVYIANYPVIGELYSKYKGPSEQKGYVCYIGRMCEENGTRDLAIASAKACIPLVLAGNESYLNNLRALPEFHNIEYKGYVDRNGIIDILQHATIGAYVNRHVAQNAIVDTFGIKVYEYMAMGLPIVVDRSFYSERVIEKWKCGICVEQGNVEEITKALLYLKCNGTEAHKMGENGRRAVAREFNWETQENNLLQLYRDLR